jgi:dephospho-CoA kinase
MIRVAVIGGIGSGKTFVANLFKCPVFNADNEVKIIYKTNKACFNKLKKILPSYIKSFPIKKKELAEAISKDKKNLKKISYIVHPLVRQKMNLFLKKNKKQKIVLLDIPLLIENKLNKKGDILIFIKSKKSKILHRLKKRPNFNLEFLKNLQKNQTMLSKKIKLANYIVHNNYPTNIMKKKINLLKKRILYERNSTRY